MGSFNVQLYISGAGGKRLSASVGFLQSSLPMNFQVLLAAQNPQSPKP